jgi:hypothetical protein
VFWTSGEAESIFLSSLARRRANRKIRRLSHRDLSISGIVFHLYLKGSSTMDSSAEYDRLRNELQELRAAPVPDLPAIDRVIGELERIQRHIKEEHGHKGNNPHE